MPCEQHPKAATQAGPLGRPQGLAKALPNVVLTTLTVPTTLATSVVPTGLAGLAQQEIEQAAANSTLHDMGQ